MNSQLSRRISHCNWTSFTSHEESAAHSRSRERDWQLPWTVRLQNCFDADLVFVGCLLDFDWFGHCQLLLFLQLVRLVGYSYCIIVIVLLLLYYCFCITVIYYCCSIVVTIVPAVAAGAAGRARGCRLPAAAARVSWRLLSAVRRSSRRHSKIYKTSDWRQNRELSFWEMLLVQTNPSQPTRLGKIIF